MRFADWQTPWDQLLLQLSLRRPIRLAAPREALQAVVSPHDPGHGELRWEDASGIRGDIGVHEDPCFSKVVQVAVGAEAGGVARTCALRSDGTLWCWGNNRHGELGNGTETTTPPFSRFVPGLVTSLGSSVAGVGVGRCHICAKKVDGTLWCWGMNVEGELGIGASGLHENTRRSLYACGSVGATDIIPREPRPPATAIERVGGAGGGRMRGCDSSVFIPTCEMTMKSPSDTDLLLPDCLHDATMLALRID